jgi:hypothetical protein
LDGAKYIVLASALIDPASVIENHEATLPIPEKAAPDCLEARQIHRFPAIIPRVQKSRYILIAACAQCSPVFLARLQSKATQRAGSGAIPRSRTARRAIWMLRIKNRRRQNVN